jgi:hypothetical protein
LLPRIPKFAFVALAASPVREDLIFDASCTTAPGCAISATSGGSPPATRLLTSTDVLSPPEVGHGAPVFW